MSRGKGVGSGPIEYLLGRNYDREGAKLLYGNPVMTEHLINSSPFENKYKSGVLSFTEQADSLSDAQKRDIMQRFEDTIFAGLEPDQYDILWVEHSDKDGRLELNFVIPCLELRSGNSLQPFYAGADLVRVNAFKNIINYEYQLTNPDDPKRKRLINPYVNNAPRPVRPIKHERESTRQSTENRAKNDDIIKNPKTSHQLKEAIDQQINLYFQDLCILNRRHVLECLTEWGLTIKRTTKKSISVLHPNFNQNIRLKGRIYEADFNERYYSKKDHNNSDLQYHYVQTAKSRYQNDLQTWQIGMTKKRDFHQSRYGHIKAPEPFDLTPKPNPTEPAAPKAAPKAEPRYESAYSFRP